MILSLSLVFEIYSTAYPASSWVSYLLQCIAYMTKQKPQASPSLLMPIMISTTFPASENNSRMLSCEVWQERLPTQTVEEASSAALYSSWVQLRRSKQLFSALRMLYSSHISYIYQLIQIGLQSLMAVVQSMRTVLQCLREGKEVSEDLGSRVAGESAKGVIFRLVLAVHNSSLSANASVIQDNNNRTIILLQQLTVIIAQLTSFKPTPKLLAQLKKYDFYEQCAENAEFQPLGNKVFGLFPRTSTAGRVPKLLTFDSKICEDETVGNPNWLLTRSILIKWMNANIFNMSLDVELSLSILLSLQTTLMFAQGLWEKLWTYLYLWLTRVFLEPYLGKNTASWCTFDNQIFISLIEDLRSQRMQPQHATILNLVIFIIKEYICKVASEENEYFKLASTSYFRIKKNNHWLDLLTVQVLKRLSSNLGHNLLAQEYEKIIETCTNNSKSIPMDQELEFLLPHIMKSEQVVDYIVQHKLNFWEYGLDERVNQQIAINYLQDIHKFKEEEVRHRILLHLHEDAFVRNVLGLELGRKNEKAVVITIVQFASQLAEKFHKGLKLSQGQCRADLLFFATQWESYFNLQEEGIIAENYQQNVEFLTFGLESLTQAFRTYAKVPQQSPENFLQILQLFTDYALQHCIDPFEVLLNPNFLAHFLQLDPQTRSNQSQSWSGFLLHPSSLASLLSIS